MESNITFASIACNVFQALVYFEQLKESLDGWEVCAEALAKGVYSDDHVKFFCFQVLEHQIKFRYLYLAYCL
ncbi:hypothetical protein DNTS_025200, partial [Danionella cerebrum]